MKKFVSAVLTVCLISIASTAWSETIYVDAANNSGVELGTAAAPFDTIVEGIEAAQDYDTVSVAPGIYYGRVNILRPVNLVSQQGPKVTIIDGLGSDAVSAMNVGYSLSINIEGFTITNGYYSIFVYYTSWVNVRDCIVKDSPIGVRASIGSGVRFYNTVFSNISHQAVASIWNGGPEFNNVTIDGASTAIWLYQTPLRLNNTTITNVGTVFDFRRDPAVRGSHVNIWNYDTYFSSEYDQSRFWLTDIISVDPLFVDPPNDYRLQSGSPLIDAGTDIGLPFVGAAPDIGAYEFEELSLPEEVEELASSIAEAPAEIFRGPDEQRRDALYQKVEAVLNMVFSMDNGNSPEDRVRVLNGCLSKLQNDILAKTDGNHGGNPDNDWIIDSAEKTELYNNLLNLIETVQDEIDSINPL